MLRKHRQEGAALEVALWSLFVVLLGAGLILVLRREAHPVTESVCDGMPHGSQLGFVGLLVAADRAPAETRAVLRVGQGVRAGERPPARGTCLFALDSGAMLTAHDAELVFTSPHEVQLVAGQLHARLGASGSALTVRCQGQAYRLDPAATLALAVIGPESHHAWVLADRVWRATAEASQALPARQPWAFRGGERRLLADAADPPTAPTALDVESHLVSSCGLMRLLHPQNDVPLVESPAHDYLLMAPGPPITATSRLSVDIAAPGRYFVQDASGSITGHVPPNAFLEADYPSAISPHAKKAVPPGRYRPYFLALNTSVVTDPKRRLRGRMTFARPVAGLITSKKLLSDWTHLPPFATPAGLDFDAVVLSEDRRTVEVDLLAFDDRDSLCILVAW